MHGMAAVTAGLLCLAGCRGGGDLASREQTPREAQTASPYSTGTDSAARGQRIEGTSRGVGLEAPKRIPGVVATLGQITQSGKAPSQENLTALRGQLGTMEDAMRNDFVRVGLADSGAFHALRDSISSQLGGGAGGLSKQMDAKEFQELEGRVRRLIDVYQESMKAGRH